MFTSYKAYDGRYVVFRRNLKGKVVGGGYSQTSKAYIVLNKETIIIEESLNVTFDESFPEPKSSPLVEDDRIIEPIAQNPIRSPSLKANASKLSYSKSLKKARGHPIEQVIDISSTRILFYCLSTSTLNFKKIRFYRPSSCLSDPPINGALVHNIILKQEFHCEIIPSPTWDNSNLHDHLKLCVDVLLINVFIEIEAKKELPIIVRYMLYYIETTPFNFAYFLAKRMDGLDFNKDPIPFARIITTLVKFIKNEHPTDTSRVMEVDDVSPM
ncbi:hypothetical protein Tco_0499797 [Tanacetum coccineum]